MRLVLLFGPPAVGKMAVGRELVRQGGFRLAHNHAVLEPLLEVFDYGTPSFVRLLAEFRSRIVEEAASSGTDLVLTFVWGLDLEEDAAAYGDYLRTYEDSGAGVYVVELFADLGTRLERNGTEERLAAKPSKRDVVWSDGNVRDLEAYRLSTAPGVEGPGERLIAAYPFLRIDNSDLSAEDAAAQVLGWLDSFTPSDSGTPSGGSGP